MSKIELLVVRDPDGPAHITVYIDGAESTDYRYEVVDAGAGHMRSEWVETDRRIAADADLTPAFREALLAARQDPPGGGYIEDDRQSPWDVAWELNDANDLVALWDTYLTLDEEEKDRLDGFACEQVSRLLVDKLIEAGWDAFLIHGDDAQSVDGMIGDHYWVGVNDSGMVLHLDPTYLQFANVADPQVALAVDGAGGQWPLQWHTAPELLNRHPIVRFGTITTIPTHAPQA